MPSMKHIKRRISSVRSTRQITKAMDLVAASKLQKIKTRLKASRLMLEQSMRIIEEAQTHKDALGHIFTGQGRWVKSSAYLVMTSNRGLCGGYNVNIVKKALAHMEDEGKNEKIIALGDRGRSYFKRRGKNILPSDAADAETAFYEDAEMLAQKLIGWYRAGEIDEVYVAYTQFESTLSHKPQVVKLLPIDATPQDEEWQGGAVPMRHEPNHKAFLDAAIPHYLSMAIYGAMTEAVACEQAARMMSMDAATKNAEDIIDDLTLMYNRQRQSFITQEINEIVGGANSLR